MGPAFSPVGVEDGKSRHRGVEETMRGEQVKGHDVDLSNIRRSKVIMDRKEPIM